MATRAVSPSHAVIIIRVLKQKFPWIGSDKEVSGADVVDDLNDLMDTLRAISKRNRLRFRLGGSRPGSGRPFIETDTARIIEMRDAGLTWGVIADKFGISIRTAQRAAKRGSAK